jgi:hypothetical protein
MQSLQACSAQTPGAASVLNALTNSGAACTCPYSSRQVVLAAALQALAPQLAVGVIAARTMHSFLRVFL